MRTNGVVRFLAGLSMAVLCAVPLGAATVTVNSTADTVADDGQCTLREAIEATNRNAASGSMPGECAAGAVQVPGNTEIIDFKLAGQGPFVFAPATPLPPVTETVLIDGYTQAGAKPNTLQSGNDAVILLELRGDAMSVDCTKPSPLPGGAVQFVGPLASGSRLRGFAIYGFQGDVVVAIFRASSVQIDGNFIGLDAAGLLNDNSGYGVAVMNGAFQLIQYGREGGTPFDDGGPGNLVGGSSPAERNVISANHVGVFLGGQRNRVDGNYIGVSVQGDASIPNRNHGVLAGTMAILDCTDKRTGYQFQGNGNDVGGRGNFFSAEGDDCAVAITARDNRVVGNRAGTDRNGGPGPGGLGLAAQPGCGVLLEKSARGNEVSYNTIAYASEGVVVRDLSATGNVIRANSIHSNMGIGIDLANDDVTPNDTAASDFDLGPNGLQNFPEGLAATPSGVRGVASGMPNTELRVDFYQNTRCDSSGFGEGERYLGSTSVLTDAKGRAGFSASVPGLVLERFVTATATSPTEGTSEFSECVPVRSGISAQVELTSSRNPARSRGGFVLTVTVRGSGGVKPMGVVTLYDVAHSMTMGNGQVAFHQLAYGKLDPSHPDPDVSTLTLPSSALTLYGTLWGNVRMRAEFHGDSTYAPASSMELVQTLYREKSDLDGDGRTDLLLCSLSSNDKHLIRAGNSSFSGPFALPALGSSLAVLGTGEFGFHAEPAVLWRDAAGVYGGTTFSGGTTNQDFDIPLASGLTVEALGSMYGDLKHDFVVRDGAGQHSGVLTAQLKPGVLALSAAGAVGAANTLHVEHVGDFNGDGHLDWLLRLPGTIRHFVWLLDGAFKVASSNPLAFVPVDGRIAATGDFDGDGRTDLVWELPTGEVEIALQNGWTTVRQTTLGLAGAGKQVVGTGFFDDGSTGTGGRSSLVLRRTTPMAAQPYLEAWINTGVDAAGLPVFGTPMALPTGAISDLTVCVP
jgi:CSLREA domain-containing protein